MGYLLQAGHGQWQLLRARKPVDALIANPSTDARAASAPGELARDGARLRQPRARRCPTTAATAATARSGATTWCGTWWRRRNSRWRRSAGGFRSPARSPIAAIFAKRNARRYAATLAAHGYDTYVGGVSAYSTLGKFADPLLDTMLRYGDLQLVGTMFHELAHQLIYVPGDSEFNEAFAMSVERAGVARWLESQGRGAELAAYRERMQQQARAAAHPRRWPCAARAAVCRAAPRGATCARASGKSWPRSWRARATTNARRACAAATTPGSRPGSTTRTWPRWPPISIACRASSACSPRSTATCASTTPRCARWRAVRPRARRALCAQQGAA